MGSFLLPVTVLSMLLLATTVQAQSSGSTGLKLCGREFVRAVVYMCGGSRWRRDLTGPTSEGYYSDPTGLESTESPLETQRQRRDMTQLLSAICCQVGCRKSDIIKLC
ncbi:insulin-like 5b isoform X2 [Sardina pilchardus]|uniref:insulin-like 5b isoform X2 n=1 Tax=Sardina pilchardus TaxID=27697 RepID=UPI002E0D1D68